MTVSGPATDFDSSNPILYPQGRFHLCFDDLVLTLWPESLDTSAFNFHTPSIATFRQPTMSEERIFPARAPSHTNSLTWIKPKNAVEEQWEKVNANLRKMELNTRSPFVPQSYTEYLAHLRGLREESVIKQKKRMEYLRRNLEIDLEITKIHSAFGGRSFNDGNSGVLCLPTIWSTCRLITVQRPEAPWPCREEMKEEGDERNTSGFRRFPALPRVPGNVTVNWKQRSVLPQLPLDQVWLRPTAESLAETQSDADDVEEAGKMTDMLGSSLLGDLDHHDESAQ